MWLAPRLSTEKTLKGREADVPPPGVGFETEIAAQPRLARSACGTVAVSSVLLLKLVLRAVPFSSTVEPLVKFVPVNVITVSLDPLTITGGEIAESVGVRLYALPVVLSVDVA